MEQIYQQESAALEPATSVQRFLGTQELITAIASFLETPEVGRLCQANIAIYQASVSVLWRVLPSPMPLLRLFGCLEEYGGQYQLNGLPSPEEIARFNVLAGYLRILQSVFYSHEDGKPISLQSFLIIHSCSVDRSSTIFPALKSATLRDQKKLCFRLPLCASYFLQSPAVTSLTVDISALDSSLLNDIPGLFKECRQTLTHLNLRGSRILAQPVADGLANFHHLHRLTIDLSQSFLAQRKDRQRWTILCQTLPSIDTLHIHSPPRNGYILEELFGKHFDTIILSGSQATIRRNTSIQWKDIHIRALVIALALASPDQAHSMSAKDIASSLDPHIRCSGLALDLRFYHTSDDIPNEHLELYFPLYLKRHLVFKCGFKNISTDDNDLSSVRLFY